MATLVYGKLLSYYYESENGSSSYAMIWEEHHSSKFTSGHRTVGGGY